MARILRTTIVIIASFGFLLLPAGPHPLTPPSALAASGATSISPANFSFNAPSNPTGSPPNFDFEIPGENVGTPPANHNFATGSFSSWTLTGTGVVESGGPSSSGKYAKLGNGGAGSGTIVSSAFNVETNAQVMSLQRAYLGTGGQNSLFVYVLSGPTYSTQTSVYSQSCTCTTVWARIDFDIATWRGQSIKLKVQGYRYVGVTDVGTSSVELANWTVDSGVVQRKGGAPTDDYAELVSGQTQITSTAFAIGNAQSLTFWSKIFTSGGAGTILDVYVIPSGGAAVKVVTRTCSCFTDWEKHYVDVTDWAGQQIQVRATRWTGSVGPIGIDDLGLTTEDVPGWQVTEGLVRRETGGPSDTFAYLYEDPTNFTPYTNGPSTLTSSPFTVTANYPILGVSTKFFSYRSSGNVLTFYVLSGQNFGTTTTLFTKVCYCATDWQYNYYSLSNWAGQTIKLKMVRWNGSDGPVGVDDVAANFMAAKIGWERNSAHGGDPVNTVNGNFYHNHTDLLIPGRGIPLEFSRYYNSASTYQGDIGHGWTHNYSMGLAVLADQSVLIQYPDGHSTYFTYSGGVYTPPAGIFDSLIKNGDGTYKLTTVSLIKYNFSSAGKLTSMVDRNGNTTTLNYTSGALTSVSDPGGRSLTLTYESLFDVINTPQPAAVFTNSDFEAGTYSNWTTTGTAFGTAPTNKAATGKQGTYWASSYYGTSSSGDDVPTGTVESQSFTAGKQLTFLINGGSNTAQVWASLVLSDNSQVLTTAADTNSMNFASITWDTTPYEGQTVKIRATDNGTASWGRIGIDHVQVINGVPGTHVPQRNALAEPFTNGGLETGNYANWFSTGTAFGRRPASASETNGNGLYKIASTDADTGTLTSTPFTAGDTLMFLLAGSNSPSNAYATLVLADNSEVLQTTASGYDDLTTVTWNTKGYAGQTVRFRLVDNVSTAHIAADYLQILYGNRLTKVTDPLPAPNTRTVEFSYDGNGDLVQVKDVKGGLTNYAYSGHRLTSLIDANNHTAAQNIYDSANRVVEQRDALNGLTCIYYGSEPAYTSVACPGVTPAPQAGQTVLVDPRSKKTTYDFDMNFRTTDIKDHDGGIVHYDFDANSNVSCITDQRGKKTSSSYDTKGNITQMIDALNTDASCALKAGGVKWTYDYTANNDLERITDPPLAPDTVGRKSENIYDSIGNLTRALRKDANGAIKTLTCFERDSFGQATAIIQSTNLVLPVGPTDPCTGNRTFLSYDNYGNQTCTINARFSGTTTCTSDPGRKYTFIYDLGGRLLYSTNEITNNSKPVRGSAPEVGSQCGTGGTGNGVNDDPADDAVIDDGCPSTKYTYDAQNNILTVTDGLGNVTTSAYDAKGNLTSMKDANRKTAGTNPESGSAQCGTDGTGNGVNDDPADDTVTDDGCLSIVYKYDNGDRLEKVIQAAVSTTSIPTTSYAYDGNGNRISLTNPKRQPVGAAESGTQCGTAGTGNDVDDDSDGTKDDGCPSTKHAYDNLDRLQSTTDAVARVTSYQYDLASNLTQRTDARALVTKYFPDDMNRLDLVEHWNGMTLVDSVDYAYDEVSNRKTIADPTGTTSYNYDALNRPTSIVFPGPKTVIYDYDDAASGSPADYPGQRTKITYPDGKWVDYTYEPDGRMRTVKDWLSKQTLYTYDDAGHVISVKYPNGVVITYSYDSARRLTYVKNTGAPGIISNYSYILDAVGNRTQIVGSTGTDTYQYDPLYRLKQVTYPDTQTDTYAYDSNGNRITKNSTTYTYDAADQMLTANGVTHGYDNNGNQTSRGADTFTYDHENRLTQTVIAGATSPSTYNGDGLRMSHTANAVTKGYTWDVADGLPLLLQERILDVVQATYVYGLELISSTDATGSQTYFIYDGLGSTTGLTDGNGNNPVSYSYDVFGTIRTQTGSSSNYWLFTGEQRDSDSGLYYLRARYYDPALGRFLATDPVPTGNLYTYVGNNPIVMTDPSGLCGLGSLGDAWDCAEGGGRSVGLAGEWWAAQHIDNLQAYTDYLNAVYNNPTSYPQETLGLWIAWGTFGNRSRENGVTFYEDCVGACSWQRLFGYTGWTVGHNIFIQGGLDSCRLKVHELTHVGQSERYGLTWLPRYFLESIQRGYLDNPYEAEARAAATAGCQSKE